MTEPDKIGGIDRSPNDMWKPSDIDQPMDGLLEERMDRSMTQMIQNLNAILYRHTEAKPPTRWQLFRWKWRNRLGRIRDAWDVLLGRAHVE